MPVGWRETPREFSDADVKPTVFNVYKLFETKKGRRRKRSVGRLHGRYHPKTIDVTVSSKLKTNTTVVKLSPVLKVMTGHIHYKVIDGDTRLFKLSTDAKGRPYIYTAGHLKEGVNYILTVSGNIYESKTKIEKELKDIYGGDSSMIYKFKIRSL